MNIEESLVRKPKQRSFMVGPTVRVDPHPATQPLHPPPYDQLFVIFLCVGFIRLDYDYMCSEIDFARGRRGLYQRPKILQSA